MCTSVRGDEVIEPTKFNTSDFSRLFSMVFFFLTITKQIVDKFLGKKKRTKGQTLSEGVQPLSFPKSSGWFLFHDWSTTPTPLNVPPPRNSRPNYQGPVSHWFRGRGVGWLAFDFCFRKDFKPNKHPSIHKKAHLASQPGRIPRNCQKAEPLAFSSLDGRVGSGKLTRERLENLKKKLVGGWPTHLQNTSQHGNLPQTGVNI